MAKSVAINIKVNGTEQAVTNISELETAIEQLKEELKGTAIGSEEFKKLSGELQGAESKLKTLNKSFEGLEPQQKAEAFVKLGEGIAGSFAVATAALTAFGVESEEVEQAQLAVTQALTAAIGIRQIAEAGLQAQVVATTISQKAYNLAAKAGNATTKAFYTTLAANPVTAIVVAVAALAAGIYALIQAQKEQITIQDEMNDAMAEAEKNAVSQELALTSLKAIIDDTTNSDQTRVAALNELKGLLPELEGLTLDQEDALDQVNEAYERNIELIQERAKAEVLSALIIEKTKELVDTQNSSLEDNLGFWEEVGNYLQYGYNPVNVAVANSTTAVTNKLEKQNKLQKEIDEITREYTELLEGLVVLETKQEEVLEETNEEKDKQNRADREAIRLQEQLAKKKRDAANEEIKAIKEIISLQKELFPTSEVVAKLTEELGKLNSVVNQAFPDTFQQRIDEVFAIPTERTDELAELFVGFFPDLSKAVVSGIGDIGQIADATRDALAEALVGEEITQEAYNAGIELANNYEKLAGELRGKDLGIIEALFDPDEYFELVKDLKVASGVITNQITKDTEGNIITTKATTEKSLSEAEDAVGAFLERVVKGYRVAALNNEDAVQRLVNAGFKKDDIEALSAEFEAQAQARINNIILIGDTIIDVEQGIRDQAALSQQRLQEISETTALARFSVFKAESDAIIEAAGFELTERQRFLGLLKSEVEDFASFRVRAEKELIELIPEFEQLSADQRLQIIEEYYAKLKEARDKNTEDEKSSQAELIEGLSEGLQQVSQVAQTGVQVFQEYVSTQLSLLQEEESRVLDQIVGDSEEAEQKRLEVQEEYEARRKEISKQGQLAQLELTRIQAVANVAEAVTKALAEGPIIGQILAGISAAIGLAQVGIVTSQISQVQSLARGGLIMGPSHEYGGVPLAGGGVVAEGNEAVINRRGSINYRGLLNEVNMASGGAPIVSSAFDDTRLIEAITKQNRTPIKAYVLEEDITRSQNINKRLQQLSKI